MMSTKNILIGITGGIAAYKTLDLIHQLHKNGHVVKVILTPKATQFVTELSVRTLSTFPAYTDTSEHVGDPTAHIELALWANIFLIAPITANTIAKLALGLADNLLTTSVLALPSTTPLMLAPAMNTRMWDNPLVKGHLQTLSQTYPNLSIIAPRESVLACGETGMGAMATIDTLVDAVNAGQ